MATPCPAASAGGEPSLDLAGLIAIMAALRDPAAGCAWDLVQTHASLVPYVLEEAYEVADAVERGSPSDLRDELGDLLLQVVFHARVAEEAGAFAFPDVVRSIAAKMIRRHPHVFAGAAVDGPDQVAATWERIKAEERAGKAAQPATSRVLADVPLALPGLTRAVKLQRRASRVGFDWGDARLVLAKIREEMDEIAEALDAPAAGRDAAVGDEIGDLLFAVANLARHAGVDPEAAVRGTNAKFERRFAFIERRLAAKGTTPEASTLEDMDALWDEAKRAGF